jgi:hypothetical protein
MLYAFLQNANSQVSGKLADGIEVATRASLNRLFFREMLTSINTFSLD